MGVVDELCVCQVTARAQLNSVQNKASSAAMALGTSLTLCRGNTRLQGLGWLSWLERRSHITL
jgi:hypothetical protein